VFDWASVIALTVEERIEVTTRDGRRMIGTLQSVDAQQVVLSRPVTIIRRDDVLSIWAIGQDEDSLLNGYLIGASAGAALGATIQATDAAAVIIPVMTTAISAVVGGWIDRGSKGPPRRLVFMARN
jgi:small nuclear ribonucleoprotein (snRNP)-like protein